MDPQVLAIVLLLAGLALIFAELLVPSGGIIAVACVMCLAGSIYFAHRAWSTSNPILFWVYLSSLLFIIPGTLYGAFQLLTRTSLGNRVLLQAPTSEEVTPYQHEVARLRGYIGQHGKALSLMTPGGMVIVDGERLHAVARSIMIEAGADVTVIGVDGTRIIVQPRTAEEPDQPIADDSSASGDSSDSGEIDRLNPFG